ncbi:hypothetical protein D9M72_370650 [compost metagenome]
MEPLNVGAFDQRVEHIGFDQEVAGSDLVLGPVTLVVGHVCVAFAIPFGLVDRQQEQLLGEDFDAFPPQVVAFAGHERKLPPFIHVGRITKRRTGPGG